MNYCNCDENKFSDRRETTGALIELHDTLPYCWSFEEVKFMDETMGNKSRVCVIHTLHRGSIRAVVRDIICGHFRSIIPYEEREDGIFCLNKKHMFTTGFLNNWILDIYGGGGTFRDAFFSWVAKSSTSTAEFHIIESVPSVNRQTGNEAFCRFLMLLRFPNSDFTELFTCNECTNRDLPGKERIDAVVMDGTALEF